MKYLADSLTVLRIVTAIVTLWSLYQGEWAIAAASFGIGLLTDAFDGVAARRWPYTDADNARLPWRRNPHAFDNFADLSLCTAGLLGVSFTLLPTTQAALSVIGVAGISLMFVMHIEVMIEENRPDAAERTDVVHGFVYGAEVTALLVIMTVVATSNWPALLAAYAIVGLPLLWLKRDRLTSRPEVDYSRH